VKKEGELLLATAMNSIGPGRALQLDFSHYCHACGKRIVVREHLMPTSEDHLGNITELLCVDSYY
jgi:hypothetical protein